MEVSWLDDDSTVWNVLEERGPVSSGRGDEDGRTLLVALVVILIVVG